VSVQNGPAFDEQSLPVLNIARSMGLKDDFSSSK